jgi:hypothetical protein
MASSIFSSSRLVGFGLFITYSTVDIDSALLFQFVMGYAQSGSR